MPTNNKTRGRQPDANSKSAQIRELLKTDMSAPDIAKRVGAKVGLVYVVKSNQGQVRKQQTARASAKPSGGGQRGRQPDANSKSGRIRELLKTGMSAADIAKKMKCTPGLVYNVKSRLGGSGAPSKRGPGRPPKSASSRVSSLDGIAGVLDMVKNADRERTQLRSALEKIQAVIEGALA